MASFICVKMPYFQDDVSISVEASTKYFVFKVCFTLR